MLNVQTDYSKIASRYDEDRERYHGQRDEYLAAFVTAHRQPPVKVLDLGCGSGLWLRDQMLFFNDRRLQFAGVEPSDEMRIKAQEKVGQDIVRTGRAEAIPFEAETFDLVTSHFAFHHFADKPAAIAEITRRLNDGVQDVVLLGATGTGKTATVAWVAEQVQRPLLVLQPNKTLAAQFANELRQLFPDNAVEYFVS